MKLSTISDLPANIQDLIDQGKVTYRGCGLGKNAANTKIKVSGKEYMITTKLFNEIGGIDKMRFFAPFRRG